jgi:3-hydroxyisobutyrate dehydrogenase-like beta-hydroxyacid dehydrogenase
MAVCAVCGNDYDKAFTITMGGQTKTFDSFECAIHRLAPICEHCGVKIAGHGVEVAGQFFCCAHCARSAGGEGREIRDAVGAHPG